jgi:hypothetical protein
LLVIAAQWLTVDDPVVRAALVDLPPALALQSELAQAMSSLKLVIASLFRKSARGFQG